MREEIQNNPKLFISVIITGIVLIIIIVATLLILIWSPKKNTQNESVNNTESTETGTFIYNNTTEKQVIEKYCSDILETLSMQNKDEIYASVSKEYISSKSFNKDSLYVFLQKKGLIGKLLKFYSYQAAVHNTYGKVFEIEIGTYDSYLREKILLIESSPRNYKISFDGFIGENNTKKEIVRDGIKVSINNIREYVTEMEVKLTINNITNSDIVLNTEGNYENIYLKLNNGQEVRMSSVWLSGVTKTLTPSTTINLDLKFSPGYLSSGSVNAIVIKDVYSDISKETKDIEFPI